MRSTYKTKHLRHALAPSGEADNDAIHMNRMLSGRTTTQTASPQTNKPFRTRWRGSHLYLPLSAPITTSGFCVGWKSLILCINSGYYSQVLEAVNFFFFFLSK